MNCLLLLFFSLFVAHQEPDSLVPIPNLAAFTHPRFFHTNDCNCGMFNPSYFQLEIYRAPNEATNLPYNRGSLWIVPPNFEAGYSVIVTGKQGSFFRIKFNEEEHPVCYQCNDSIYYVKKGTLGTWIYNNNKKIDNNDILPLYENPNTNSRIVAKVKQDHGVVVIIDIDGDWMLVETISKRKKKRGWLDPKMQRGNPYGASYPHSDY